MKIMTRTFCVVVQILAGFEQSERVGLFITSERATLQECKGRLLEYAHVVHFPEACVGSEKIAIYA